MSQYDRENPIVSPHSGTELVADVNQILKAMLSSHQGTSRPEGITQGGMWVKRLSEPDMGCLYVFDGTNDVELATVDYSTGQIYNPSLPNSKRVAKLMDNNFQGGNKHCGVIMADGTMRVWGDNSNNQLGLYSPPDEYVTRPMLASPYDSQSAVNKAIKWKSTSNFHVVLHDDGELYRWGKAYDTINSREYPSRITGHADGSIVDFSMSELSTNHPHVLALGSDGKGYGWGKNGAGQAGLNSTTINESFMREIDGYHRWSKLFACGNSYAGYSYGITTDGDLYGWGLGTGGAFGNITVTQNANGHIRQYSPIHIDAFDGVAVENVYSNCMIGSHDGVTQTGVRYPATTFVKLADGRVFGWGFNIYGNLGLGDYDHHLTPQHIPSLGVNEVNDIVVTPTTTYIHKTDNIIYVAGAYNIGGGSEISARNARNFEIYDVAYKYNTTVKKFKVTTNGNIFVLFEDGTIMSSGDNSNHQLGVLSTNTPSGSILRSVWLNRKFKAIDICIVDVEGHNGVGILTECGQYLQTGIGMNGRNCTANDTTFILPQLISF